MIDEELELDNIEIALIHMMAAFELLSDADLFDELCDAVSMNYDEILEEDYADRIVDLCNGK